MLIFSNPYPYFLLLIRERFFHFYPSYLFTFLWSFLYQPICYLHIKSLVNLPFLYDNLYSLLYLPKYKNALKDFFIKIPNSFDTVDINNTFSFILEKQWVPCCWLKKYKKFQQLLLLLCHINFFASENEIQTCLPYLSLLC